MTILSTLQLAQIRAHQEAAFPDTCDLESLTSYSDNQGGYHTYWDSADTSVACRLAPVASSMASERLEGEQIAEAAQWVLTVAHDQTITVAMRVVHDSVIYQIVRLDNTHSQRTGKRAYVVKQANATVDSNTYIVTDAGDYIVTDDGQRIIAS